MNTKDRILDFIKKGGGARADDLHRKFNISRAMVHRHLIDLQKAGFVVKLGKSPIVFYKPAQPATKNKEIDRITRSLVKNYRPEKIILFGSAARREETKDSDLDLFVVKNTRENFFDRLVEARKYIKSNRDVDLVIYNPGEFEKAISEGRIFIKQVLEYGQTIYEKGGYLQ